MGIFSKQKEEKELALVFDIGSASVGGVLFEINKNGIPNIILSIREPIVFEEKIDIDRFLFLTLKSLETVAGRICMMGVGAQTKIFCVLSSPFYASATRTIKLEKNVPFLVTSKLADNLIAKEISLFQEDHASKFSQDGKEIRLVEFKNIKTMLNGYVTQDPFGKKARKLEMVVFISVSGNQILEKIENTIKRHFHAETIKFSSFAMASFAVARDIFVSQEDFLLVDIAGEVTDISMVNKDVLSNSISYPLGRNFMIRKVAESLNCNLSEAQSLFSLYKDGHAEEDVVKKLEPIIDKLKKEWLQKFQESLFNISSSISIPATIFVSVDQNFADFFSKIIKTEQFNQYTLSESEFKIIFLDLETLHKVASFGDKVSRDSFLAIESIYINRFLC